MDIKKLIEIKEVSYTLMSSSIRAIWGLIFAIILLIASVIAYAVGGSIPGAGQILSGVLGFSIGAIISFPLLIFLTSLGSNFLFALVFNIVSPKLGCIELGFEDNSKLTRIDPISYGLIAAMMGVVTNLLWNLAIQPMIYITLATTINPFMIFSLFGSIIGTIIGAGIGGFVVGAIIALSYNIIIKYVSPAIVKFEERGHGFVELVEIDPISTSISLTLIYTVWTAIFTILGIIIAAICGIFLYGLLIGILIIILTFVISFVVISCGAYIYNFLVTKIGGIKFRFEDVDAASPKEIEEHKEE